MYGFIQIGWNDQNLIHNNAIELFSNLVLWLMRKSEEYGISITWYMFSGSDINKEYWVTISFKGGDDINVFKGFVENPPNEYKGKLIIIHYVVSEESNRFLPHDKEEEVSEYYN